MTEIRSDLFKTNTASLYADNVTGNIGAGDLRTQMDNLADSTIFKATGFTAAPTANDDGVDTAGNGVFQISHFWIDQSNDKAYICLDNSTAAAVWTETTYIDAGALSATNAPAPQEMAVWVDATTLRGFVELTWDDGTSELNLTGDLVVSGTVDGRDIAVDGAKLDGMPNVPLEEIIISNENVDGGSSGFNVNTLRFATGDGIEISNPNTGEMLFEIRNNDITKDAVDRTLLSGDNASFVSNEGAAGAVTWTLPVTSALELTPRLVVNFFKVSNQTMQLVGATGVTINGVTELGGNESLIEICPTVYNTFATVIYGSNTNTYFVYQGTDIEKIGTTASTEMAFWTGNGTIDGAPELLWDGTTLDIDGEIKHIWAFNAQVGTTYTAVLSDRSKIVTMNNGAANTFTIPDSTAVAYPIGTEIRVIQIGAGTTTIEGSAGGGSVTVNGVATGSGDATAQWDEIRLYKVDTDAWYATGEIGAVA